MVKRSGFEGEREDLCLNLNLRDKEEKVNLADKEEK